jgi:hypothetical protein
MGSIVKNDIDAIVLERDKTVYWTTVAVTDVARDLELWEENIYVDTTAAAGTLTLPSVAEAAGLTFNIYSLGSTNDLTIQDRDDSLGWTDVTIEDAGDCLSIRSNGRQWVLVESHEAD